MGLGNSPKNKALRAPDFAPSENTRNPAHAGPSKKEKTLKNKDENNADKPISEGAAMLLKRAAAKLAPPPLAPKQTKENTDAEH